MTTRMLKNLHEEVQVFTGVGEDDLWRAIFPEEIWLMILNNLDNPKDMLMCTYSSLFLKRLLQPRRTVYLLPEVLDVLDQQNLLSVTYPSELPAAAGHLLRWGQVCRGWKVAMHRYLATRPYHYKLREFRVQHSLLPPPAHLDPTSSNYFRIYSFSLETLTQRILPEILNHFEYYAVNPLHPSRHLHIEEFLGHNVVTPEFRQKYGSTDLFRTAVDHILSLIGHQFWHLSIHLGTTLTMIQAHNYLCRLLYLLPNLKSIYCHWTQIDLPTFGDKYLIHSPFPVMKHLQVASFEHMAYFTVAAVLAGTPHLKSLEVLSGYEDPFLNPSVLDLNGMPELTSLWMDINSAQQFHKVKDSWKMEHLRLHVIVETLKFSDVFKKIANYADTLQELQLLLPVGTSKLDQRLAWEATSRRVLYPKLKKLTLSVSGGLFSFRFLTGMPALEQFSMQVFYTCGRGNVRVAIETPALDCDHDFCIQAYLAETRGFGVGATTAKSSRAIAAGPSKFTRAAKSKVETWPTKCLFSGRTLEDMRILMPKLKEFYLQHNFDNPSVGDRPDTTALYEQIFLVTIRH